MYIFLTFYIPMENIKLHKKINPLIDVYIIYIYIHSNVKCIVLLLFLTYTVYGLFIMNSSSRFIIVLLFDWNSGSNYTCTLVMDEQIIKRNIKSETWCIINQTKYIRKRYVAFREQIYTNRKCLQPNVI